MLGLSVVQDVPCFCTNSILSFLSPKSARSKVFLKPVRTHLVSASFLVNMHVPNYGLVCECIESERHATCRRLSFRVTFALMLALNRRLHHRNKCVCLPANLIIKPLLTWLGNGRPSGCPPLASSTTATVDAPTHTAITGSSKFSS
jgi:hypothetical protein